MSELADSSSGRELAAISSGQKLAASSSVSGFYCQNIVLLRALLSSILSWRGGLWVAARTGRERSQAEVKLFPCKN
ncbi:unnamed protein product [Gadus morhua 'NCC']